MNQMEIFKNPEFGTIRAVEIDGEPWLVERTWRWRWGTKTRKRRFATTLTQRTKG